MRHPIIATSTLGGVWLWFAAASYGGKQGALLDVLFFIFIPLAVCVSAVVTGVLILPMWLSLRRTRFGHPLTIAGALALLALLVFPLLYRHLPELLDRLKACWWAVIWLAGMGNFFAFVFEPNAGQPAKTPRDDEA